MTNCQSVLISMKSEFFIMLDKSGDKEKINMWVYQVIVRKLMYLACDIRPDISFIVGCLSQNNRDSWVGHLKTAKKVLWYLKETSQMCIKYEQLICTNNHNLLLHNYADSNYTGDLLNQKLTMSYYFYINNGVVTWCFKKQCMISTSITEAEYITLGHTAWQVIWMWRFMNELRIQATTVLLWGDNESSIKLVKNAEFHAHIKHINVQHHYIRELVSERELRIDWISTKKLWADEFIKTLSHDSFKQHHIKLKL